MNPRKGNSPRSVFGLFILLCSIGTAPAAAETVLKTQRFELVPANATTSVQFQVPGPGKVILEATGINPLKELGLIVRGSDPTAADLRKDGLLPLRLEFTVTAQNLAKGSTWTVLATIMGKDGVVYKSAAIPGSAAAGDLKVSFVPDAPAQNTALQPKGMPDRGAAVPPPVATKGRVIKAEGLTRQLADQLQNSDVIEYKGKQYDVGTLRSQQQNAEAEALATMKQKATQAQSEFEAYRKTFSQKQMTNLATANAKIDLAARQFLQKAHASGQVPPPPPSQPKITDTSASITPSARVLIVGSGFGNPTGLNAPGAVYLNIGGVSHQLAIEWWSDTRVVVTTPAGIAGVPDGRGTVVVKLGGTESNQWPVSFIAARDVILMGQGRQVLSCGNSAPNNWCRDNISSAHWGDLLHWAGKGNDVYTASLKNGWTFENATIEWGGSGVAILKGFNRSSSPLNLVVDWSFDVGVRSIIGDVKYKVELYIVGPKGVPYY
jgi:hypothetical protein